LVTLDLAGVAVSAGSACAAGSPEPSHVLDAIGAPAWARAGTLRFSFGKLTSREDVERLEAMLPLLAVRLGVAYPDLGTSTFGSPRNFSEVSS
jgi:cysteine desulfurase